MVELEVITVRTLSEMSEALSVRRRVFIEEQGVDESEEIDQHDADPATVQTAIHVLGRLEGQPVATGRLLLEYPGGENVHAGRIAVLKELRGRGYGSAIMAALADVARDRGLPGITLGAQLHAIPFYERLGYVVRGDVFLDANMPHRWMDLRL